MNDDSLGRKHKMHPKKNLCNIYEILEGRGGAPWVVYQTNGSFGDSQDPKVVPSNLFNLLFGYIMRAF
jgi:hypothetical protein